MFIYLAAPWLKAMIFTGGGQKLCTGSLVLSVADSILSACTLPLFCYIWPKDPVASKTEAKYIYLKMSSATGRTRLLVHSFCPPPVNCRAGSISHFHDRSSILISENVKFKVQIFQIPNTNSCKEVHFWHCISWHFAGTVDPYSKNQNTWLNRQG